MIRRRLTALLLLIALAGAGLLALVGLYAAAAFDPGERPGAREAILVVSAIAAGAGLAAVATMLRLHFRQLERVRGAMISLAGDTAAMPPEAPTEEVGEEVRRLWLGLRDVSEEYARVRAQPDERLRSVLTAIAEAIVVITDNGQVSLVNDPAKTLLGGERVRVGTSVFAALHRHSVWQAVRESREAGRAVEAELTTVEDVPLRARVAALHGHGGAVLSFLDEREGPRDGRGRVDHALDLHDRPPPCGALAPEAPLDDLPMSVVDAETTGLEVEEARVVSLGAVRMHGTRLYRGAVLDRLVRPEVAIPWRSTAVHGITDAMVADAPGFPAVFSDLRDLVEGTVVVGHNIAFDIAVFEHECRRHGLRWERPATLDTLLLAGALWPDSRDLSLEGLARDLGIEVRGRHTALGDCLVTGQVLQVMIPQLRDRGIATLGDAQAFGRTRKDLVRLQRGSGWYR